MGASTNPVVPRLARAAVADRGDRACSPGAHLAQNRHQIGDVGRSIGPNLSHIGAIRREIDIVESIIFPSATIARDYEAHAIECAGGETLIGLIKSHTAEGLLLVDLRRNLHRSLDNLLLREQQDDLLAEVLAAAASH